jgi:FKBP-type peptidyl-prolyl cis-trans isomerase SlyD
MDNQTMKNRVVSFHYTLRDEDGEMLDSSRDSEPMTFVEGKRQIIRGLEEQLKELSQGDKKQIKVEPGKGYGDYDDALAIEIPKEHFPPGEPIEVGDQFRLTMPGNEPRIYTVTGISDARINVDGNHPLAGMDLYFDIEVTGIREATSADTEEGCCGGKEHTHAH